MTGPVGGLNSQQTLFLHSKPLKLMWISYKRLSIVRLYCWLPTINCFQLISDELLLLLNTDNMELLTTAQSINVGSCQKPGATLEDGLQEKLLINHFSFWHPPPPQIPPPVTPQDSLLPLSLFPGTSSSPMTKTWTESMSWRSTGRFS